MRKIIPLLFFSFSGLTAFSQIPCSGPEFRRFDFWIGEWEAYGLKGQLAGNSKISLILDSCVILEEWSSAAAQKGLVYSGKSFNSYNTATRQWQQTWTDNTGKTTEFLRGEASEGKIIFYADNAIGPKGEKFIRRLTFTQLEKDRVRQFSERSIDGGSTWITEYDLEYRRKK